MSSVIRILDESLPYNPYRGGVDALMREVRSFSEMFEECGYESAIFMLEEPVLYTHTVLRGEEVCVRWFAADAPYDSINMKLVEVDKQYGIFVAPAYRQIVVFSKRNGDYMAYDADQVQVLLGHFENDVDAAIIRIVRHMWAKLG